MSIKKGTTSISKVYKGSTEVSKIYKGTTLVYENGPDYLCFTAAANGNILFSIIGTLTTTPIIYYSLDKRTWTQYTFGNSIYLSANQKCYWKGDNNSFSLGESSFILFNSTMSVETSGNIISLLDSTCISTTIPCAYCFLGMFYNSSITTPPTLPATTLAMGCYAYMFYECNSLTTAPELPATTLSDYCYNNMFMGCDSLTIAPLLPATTLANYCYSEMFAACNSLTTAPELPATTLTTGCYSGMFLSSHVNYIKIVYTGNFSTTYFNNWVNGVSATGNFYYDGNDTTRGNSAIPTGWNVIDLKSIPLCFTANTAGSTVELCKYGSPSIANTAYSRDCVTWTTFTPSTTAGTNVITLTNVGDKVYFRNNITANFSSSNYLQFKMTGSIAASGNCNSMYSSTNFANLTTLTYSYCYNSMFANCKSLTTAPVLPATTLSIYCYYFMFNNCTSLTTALALPATTLAGSCYERMFLYCTALTTAPVLPATTLANYCYYGMFLNDTSLTTPPTLPATTLAGSCYERMFSGCTSLIVSDTSGSGYNKAWRIPTSETFTNTTTYTQNSMFTNCLGTRSSNDMSGALGESHTYYTLNTPVGPSIYIANIN